MNTAEILIALTGLGGLLLGVYNAYIAGRKGTIEEWQGLLSEQRKLIEELKKKLDEREDEIEDLKEWAVRLVSQIRSLGHEPVAFKPVKTSVNHSDR